jgi:hypothetical protein
MVPVIAPKPKRPPPPPNAVGRLVIWPAWLNVTPVLKPVNCVWLNALNISTRSCNLTLSPRMGMFLATVMS